MWVVDEVGGAGGSGLVTSGVSLVTEAPADRGLGGTRVMRSSNSV